MTEWTRERRMVAGNRHPHSGGLKFINASNLSAIDDDQRFELERRFALTPLGRDFGRLNNRVTDEVARVEARDSKLAELVPDCRDLREAMARIDKALVRVGGLSAGANTDEMVEELVRLYFEKAPSPEMWASVRRSLARLDQDCNADNFKNRGTDGAIDELVSLYRHRGNMLAERGRALADARQESLTSRSTLGAVRDTLEKALAATGVRARPMSTRQMAEEVAIRCNAVPDLAEKGEKAEKELREALAENARLRGDRDRFEQQAIQLTRVRKELLKLDEDGPGVDRIQKDIVAATIGVVAMRKADRANLTGCYDKIRRLEAENDVLRNRVGPAIRLQRGADGRIEPMIRDDDVATAHLTPSRAAIQMAAQAWCDDEASNCEMDGRLANAFARILDKVASEGLPPAI